MSEVIELTEKHKEPHPPAAAIIIIPAGPPPPPPPPHRIKYAPPSPTAAITRATTYQYEYVPPPPQPIKYNTHAISQRLAHDLNRKRMRNAKCACEDCISQNKRTPPPSPITPSSTTTSWIEQMRMPNIPPLIFSWTPPQTKINFPLPGTLKPPDRSLFDSSTLESYLHSSKWLEWRK